MELQQTRRKLVIAAASLVCAAAPLLLLNVRSVADARGLLRTPNVGEVVNGRGRRGLHLVSEKNELIFVHIPKTGGTTMERSKLMDDVESKQGHATIDEMLEEAEEEGIDISLRTSLIRHPCSRFISAFRYLTSNKCNQGDQRVAAAHIGNRTLDEFVSQMNQDPVYANDILGWFHFFPQHFWVFRDNGEFGLDQVLCQEQWNESMERLFEKLPMEEDRNSLPFLEEKSGGDQHHALQNTHESCADLSESTRENIREIYALDYCIFGYDSLPQEGNCIGRECGGEDQMSCPEYFTARARLCKNKISGYGTENA